MKQSLNYIGFGTQIEGSIKTKDSLKLDGIFRGEIKSTNEIIIGSTAKITGTVDADNIVVNGEVKGKLISPGKIAILSQGKIDGDIYLSKGGLSVAKGGVFEGSFHLLHTGQSKNQIDLKKEQSTKK